MNLEWYRIFLYTAKAGNLTKAAQELHITQPSVSYAVKQLEKELGVKLFDRLSKGVRLTSEGATLLEYVEKSFATLDSGERKIASLRDYEAGELRIGASGPMIKHVLLPVLDDLRIRFPEVRIRLSQGNSAAIQSRLKDGQIDLGFVHLPFVDPELEIQQLVAIQDGFVVGPSYRSLTEQPMTTGDLAKLPLLLLSRGSSTREFIERWFGDQRIAMEADIELNSFEMLVELAHRGYGAAFVTRSFIEQEIEQGLLIELPTAEKIPARHIAMATRRGISVPLIATQFMQMLSSGKRML
ncbi:LysR family transcriptional regulator [Cohnella terricola]|uniref:LysR family transcriptional regulator n=2 Tax=Cohnella terricola TaxID=1289167 RepID=A0A559JAP5_9BACL|nr:LysR family transcriptional regulator [Cohnella terricola]